MSDLAIRIIVWSISALIISAFLSFMFGKAAIRWGVKDEPDNTRKMQTAPIPRLGGVAYLLAIFITLPLASSVLGIEYSPHSLHFFAFTIAAALIGLWDDFSPPPALLKLVMIGLLCLGFGFINSQAMSFQTPFGDVTSIWLLTMGSALWLLVFTNAANFMDGLNGLMSGCLAIMLTGLAYSVVSVTDNQASVVVFPLLSVLLGAIIGFLIHNLRGKLYAGDAGSLGLGALFASLGLVSGVQVWTVATLALPFLIDVLMTLIWRAKHGRPWLKPHLDHAYQKLRLSGWSHIETASLYWGLSTVCAVAAVIAAKAGGNAPFFVFWGLCLSGIVIWSVHRRGHPS